MNISEPFIRRPIATSLLALGVMILGITAYNFLPVAPLPNVEFPSIYVSASLPGADPSTAASSLAAPLERRFATIAGITEMTSTSTQGGVGILLQFDLSRSIDGATRDVQAAINASANELPPDIPQPPNYRKANPNDAPIMVLAMTSDAYRLSELYNFCYQILAPKISQITGVSQVDIGGGAKSAVRVQINPPALASMGLTLDDVRTALTTSNSNLPKGGVSGGGLGYAINSNTQLFEAVDYKHIIIAQKNGTPIPLNAIGSVVDANENVRMAGWYNDKRAVLLIIRKQSDANIIETVDQVRAALPQLERWLPPSVKLSILSDRTNTIRASVRDVQHSLLISICLVVMVCFIFLRRFWPTFIASITVPLSLLATFGIMYLLHFSLDNISLMALTISVGFVVDDAIVVIENIVRYLEKGCSPFEAALKGAKQVGFTVISISISLIAVFIPLLFMGGLVGRLFHEFAVTLSVAIIVSAIVSLTVTPMMSSRFLRSDSPEIRASWFYRFTENILNSILHWYAVSLKWVLRHSFLMLLLTLAVLAITVVLYIQAPKGFFPVQDTGMMFGSTEAAQDISFAAMVEKQKAVTEIIVRDPDIAGVGSFLGSSGGGGQGSNTGRLYITLKPRSERHDTILETIARLRKNTAKIPGVSLFLQPVQDIRVGGRASKALYIYSLVSPSLEDLNRWAPKLVAKLKEQPELSGVSSDQQFNGLQTNVIVDRDAAARLGIQPQQIDNALYNSFGQRQISVLYAPNDQYHLILEADPKFQQDPNSLDKMFLRSSGNVQVPLSSIARFETVNTPTAVPHQGQFPAISISFDVAPGVSLGEATKIIDRAAEEIKLAPSIRGSFQGTARAFQDTASSQLLLILTAIIVVYIVLGVLYESLIHPITILSTLPSAGLGALLALQIGGFELSVVAMIGIVLLIGNISFDLFFKLVYIKHF
ncbi:MAG: efflux RND transporter permease subunit [Chthoniobacterales bacterium]